jgi:hypothetical protein
MFRNIALDQDTKHLVWAFCCGEHTDCGRYKKIVAGERFPAGLMPTGEIMLTDSVERPTR